MEKHIDHIFYINLDKRGDRRELLEAELNMFDLSYERFVAIEHEVGYIGCARSHLAVLELAKERGYNNTLILEDDFTFLVSREVFYEEVDKFFDLYSEKYDVCMFSYNVLKSEEISGEGNVSKIVEAQSASGYMVHRDYLDKLIELYRENNRILAETGVHWIYANDQIWKRYQPHDNWYFFKVRLGKQRAGYSDIGQMYLEHPC